MPHANLTIVKVEKPSSLTIGLKMNELRQWLDHRNIRLIDFRPIPDVAGYSFELSFRTEDDALLFERDFPGTGSVKEGVGGV